MLKLRMHVASIGSFLLGVGLFLAGVGVVAPQSLLPSAEAGQSIACIDDGDYGWLATMEDRFGPYYDNSHGTRASVYVGAAPTDCQRISSLYVGAQGGGGFIEFGWVLGWSNCTRAFYNLPHPFYWRQDQTTGEWSCGVFGSITIPDATYQDFQVSDTNENTLWNLIYNGSYLDKDPDTDFVQGSNLTGMERGAAQDSGYARWRWLDEHHTTNSWTRWDNAVLREDADPDYHYHREEPYIVSVQRD